MQQIFQAAVAASTMQHISHVKVKTKHEIHAGAGRTSRKFRIPPCKSPSEVVMVGASLRFRIWGMGLWFKFWVQRRTICVPGIYSRLLFEEIGMGVSDHKSVA